MKRKPRKRIYCCTKRPQDRPVLDAALKSEGVLLRHFARYRACVEKLSVRTCDLLIVDLAGCQEEALALIAQVRRMAPWIMILAIVERAGVVSAVEAVRAGACECLERPLQVDSVHRVVEEQFAHMPPRSRARQALTQMEIQIIQLVLAGRTSHDIAAHLHRSKRTIDVHRKNIMRKLQACSLVDFIKRALEMGLTPESGCDEPSEE
jgi:FixJ family two-component response regulator